MFSRKDIEDRENRELASFAMKSMDSKGRKFHEDEHMYRSVFQRDKDRIIHCTAFRRLEYKTQVFVNHEGDYFRTRLTHTMEVAQISRSIARALNLNEDLTEAIALSHDLGHTPFGHSGEDALKELMKDNGGFNHNFQALRVLDILEQRYPVFSGLNLSWEIKESILKHGYTSYEPGDCHKEKHTENEHNKTVINEIFNKFGSETQPLLEAQLVDIADSIAYDNHDIDDSLNAGIINEKDLMNLELWRFASGEVNKKYKFNNNDNIRMAQTIKFLIDLEATDLIEHSISVIERQGIKTVDDVRNADGRILAFSSELERQKEELQKFLKEKVYENYRVVRMADKAKRFLKELFNEFTANPKQLPPYIQENIDKTGLHQNVCDYIAGMTDRYAQDEYKKLFYPYERV